jgi:hypothetical protein
VSREGAREQQNLWGEVELFAGTGAASSMVLLHHGHCLCVHSLQHRTRYVQNSASSLKCRSDEWEIVTHQGLEVERALRRDLLARLKNDRDRESSVSVKRGRTGRRGRRPAVGTYLEEVGVGGDGEEGGVGGEVVALELVHQVRHLRWRRREGRCGGIGHGGRISLAGGEGYGQLIG